MLAWFAGCLFEGDRVKVGLNAIGGFGWTFFLAT
jgi:hypothetical protein